MWKITFLTAGLGLLPLVVARPGHIHQRRDATPYYPYDPNTTPYCTWWIDNNGATPCQNIPAAWAISLADFIRWNPSITPSCGGFEVGKSYCVEAYGEPEPSTTSTAATTTTSKTSTTTTTTTTSKTSTTTATTVATTKTTTTTAATTTTTTGGAPGETQVGQIATCNQWDLVNSGDTCSVFLAKYPGLTLANLVAWNPAIGSDCANLWADTYLCTGVTGGSTSTGATTATATTTTTTTTTTAGNGITTPTPTQPGMITDCNAFYKVQSGDGCEAIALSNGITLAQFIQWNPSVGSDCESLYLDYYVCISRIGTTTTTTATTITTTTKATAATTTTTSSNGITTPTPIQPGMVSNCDAFYYVASDDDGCAQIAHDSGISLSQFYAWNPTVGTDCSSLWTSYYVCVSVIGVSPSATTTTTTTKATTTTAGNGVATPTPIEPGMPTSCKTFHKVVSGDECGVIASNAGITLANFIKWNPTVGSDCSSLWLDYYVCIAVL